MKFNVNLFRLDHPRLTLEGTYGDTLKACTSAFDPAVLLDVCEGANPDRISGIYLNAAQARELAAWLNSAADALSSSSTTTAVTTSTTINDN